MSQQRYVGQTSSAASTRAGRTGGLTPDNVTRVRRRGGGGLRSPSSAGRFTESVGLLVAPLHGIELLAAVVVQVCIGEGFSLGQLQLEAVGRVDGDGAA